MKRIREKIRMHIRLQLLAVNVLALLLALVFYFIADKIGEVLTDQYFEVYDNTADEERKDADDFQKYVFVRELSMKDFDKIDRWVEENAYLFLKLYDGHALIYDSIFGVAAEDTGIRESPSSFPMEHYYKIKFTDGTGYALFYSFGELETYDTLSMLFRGTAFIIFLFSVSLFHRKKICYLLYIESCLKALNQDLNQEIDIRGEDELASVATGINNLRLSVLHKMEEEKKAYQANHKLITALSHDVRTPLTSLIGYLELTQGENSKMQDMEDYQRLALEKAYRLKDLTDKLFEYFLVSTPTGKDLSKDIFYGNELVAQMVEENLFELESAGFIIRRHISDINCRLLLNIDLMYRLFDNIISNIKKYADISSPIEIRYKMWDGYLELSFENKELQDSGKNTGSHIGLKSCQAIVDIHHGKLDIQSVGGRFCVFISIPVIAE